MMLYLINGTLNAKNTIIEKTSLKRLKMFNEMGVDATLLLMHFSPNWRKTAGTIVAQKGQIKSLFDELQGFEQPTASPLSVNDFHDLDGYFRMHPESRDYQFQDGDLTVAEAQTDKRGKVEQVRYFDRLGNQIQLDYFNDLGRLAMTAYQRDGVTAAQTYFDQADKTALTATFDQKHYATFSKAGQHARFYSRQDLELEFLEQRLKPGDIVVTERTDYDELLAKLPQTILKVGTIYNEIPKKLAAYDALLVRNDNQAQMAEKAGVQVVRGNDYQTDGTEAWTTLLASLAKK